MTTSLKRKCHNFDEIFITGCTGSCHFDNFQCSQWWKFCQNDNIFIVVLFRQHQLPLAIFCFSFDNSLPPILHQAISNPSDQMTKLMSQKCFQHLAGFNPVLAHCDCSITSGEVGFFFPPEYVWFFCVIFFKKVCFKITSVPVCLGLAV